MEINTREDLDVEARKIRRDSWFAFALEFVLIGSFLFLFLEALASGTHNARGFLTVGFGWGFWIWYVGEWHKKRDDFIAAAKRIGNNPYINDEQE